MQINQRILSDLIIHMKYARYVPELQRRELWPEICDRYASMLIERYPSLETEIKEKMQSVLDKKVLPSMRAMQFAGVAIRKNNSRIYNCAYMPVDDIRAFSEAIFCCWVVQVLVSLFRRIMLTIYLLLRKPGNEGVFLLVTASRAGPIV